MDFNRLKGIMDFCMLEILDGNGLKIHCAV